MTLPASPQRTNARLTVATVFFALSRGVDIEEIVAATGVAADQLFSAEAWLPQDVVPRIWRLLSDRFPGEALTLEMARLVPLEQVFGDLAVFSGMAADLRGLLRLFVDNAPLLSDRLRIEVRERDGGVHVSWSHPMDALDGGCAAELGAAVAVRLGAERLGARDALRAVSFGHRPRGPIAAFVAFFGVPVHFAAEAHGLVLDARMLDLPNPAADPVLQGLLQARLDQRRAELGAATESERMRRVRVVVAENAASGDFSSEGLARRLGVSLRVLQRQLAEEGTEPRLLLDEARRQRAWALLHDSRKSIEEIAQILGYATERSFRRAFERWTGLSPARARREAERR